MSNCVCSSGLGLPASAVAQHGVKRGDHLAHDGDKDDFGLLAGSVETVVECFEGGVVTAGAEGRHVEDVSHRHAAAVYAAMSGQARVTAREIGLGGDHLGEALVEEADIGLDPRQAALGQAPEHGVLKLCGLVSIATCSSQSWRRTAVSKARMT